MLPVVLLRCGRNMGQIFWDVSGSRWWMIRLCRAGVGVWWFLVPLPPPVVGRMHAGGWRNIKVLLAARWPACVGARWFLVPLPPPVVGRMHAGGLEEYQSTPGSEVACLHASLGQGMWILPEEIEEPGVSHLLLGIYIGDECPLLWYRETRIFSPTTTGRGHMPSAMR